MPRRSVVVRRHRVKMVAIAVVVVAVLGAAGSPHAGILNPGPVTGSGSTPVGGATGFVFTTLPGNTNNDNSAGSPNFFALNSQFTSVGPIDYVFLVTGSSGTTEYISSQITINNTTTATWTGFRFELGFGVGTGFINNGNLTASTTPPGPVGGLDFDTGIAGTGTAPTTEKDPRPTSGPTLALAAFSTLSHGDYIIDWSGGSVAPGGVVSFTLSTDIPDLPLTLTGFTLRQLPIAAASVPEPASLLLLGSGLAGLGAWRLYPNRHVKAVTHWVKSAAVN